MANKSTSQVYRKRPGTSGIRGQLYETKLLSLIYFRALYDDNVEEFYLATNVDQIGVFDDICLRVKLKSSNKPIAVFIQAKHRENDKLLTLTNKNDLANYFSSYLNIKRAFQPSNEDPFFKGTFCETDCVFVMYTTAKGDGSCKPCEDSLVRYLNNTIATGNPGSQPLYTDEDVDLLSKKVLDEELTILAQKMAKYIFDDAKNQMQIMNDELVVRYHVILAKNIFDISDIQPEGHRIARLRQDFFSTKHTFLQILIFKDALYSEILERRKVDMNETKGLLIYFLTNCENSSYLSRLIGNEIKFENGTLEFRHKTIPTNYKHCLGTINGMPLVVRQAVELAVRESIPSPHFKVPAVFGNKDISIRGNDGKIEKRLDYLCNKLTDLIEKTKPNNIVTIDESIEDGFLRLNGGIASAVGNILVFDDTSKLLKFCENPESLGNIAKRFFEKLESKILNMQDYKFDVKLKMFPKLSFTRSEHDDQIVKDFFSKLVFYSSQGDENDVEDILKEEIQNSQASNHNVEIRSEAIFLKYHDEVQKWWMIPKEGSYLTKKSELYKNAVDSTSQSLMGIINMMHKIKYKDYSFTEDAVNSLQLQDRPSRTVIITDNSALTIAKLLTYMKNKDLVALDLEYIVQLPARDYNTLHGELTTTNKVKTLVIVVDKNQNLTPITRKRLEKIALILKDQNCIIVAIPSSVAIVESFFSPNDNVIKDERNNLTDLDEGLQKNILENSKVIFQGEEVTLGNVLDNETVKNVGGEVLYHILNRDRNILGKPIVDSNFNITECVVTVLAPVTAEVSDIGMAFSEPQNGRNFTRLVHKDQLVHFIHLDSLREITGDVTVIVANPGMGKTTFLSQVSTVVKQHHPTVWILRINLLEYAIEFSKWRENETVIDTLESLKLMCQVALGGEQRRMNEINMTLKEADGIVLQDCTGDQWTVFELKMFLHGYNTGKVLFLFDGFDEICPHYAYEVLTLIKVLENHPLKHKIWITSRSYDKIVTILELKFGKLYEIVPWTHAESFRFLNMIWDRKKILKDLNNDQLRNVYKFIKFMADTYKKEIAKKRNDLQIQANKEIPFTTIYFWFIKHLRANLTSAPPDVMSSLNKLCEQSDDRSQIMDEFVASPLLLNLISDYLYNKIRESNECPNKWYIDTNIFKVYESVLETKLKRIRFEEKNQIDMCKPDNIIAFMKEYAYFVATHKKVAAYALFRRHCDKLFNIKDFNEFNHVFEMLEQGLEKSGIICNVVNDIPIFVHSTFAEYFAVEFICDLMRDSSCMTNKRNERTTWDFILNVMFFQCNLDVLATLDAKLEIDKDLTTTIKEENKIIIFELLMEQSKNTEIKSSLCEAIRYDLRNLENLLLSTIKNNLDKNNLMDFIKIVNKTKLLMTAIKMEFEEVIVTIIEYVRLIDKSKLNMLYANYGLNEDIEDVSNDVIIHELHKHVWTRMDIIPDWNNLAELSGQIYFI